MEDRQRPIISSRDVDISSPDADARDMTLAVLGGRAPRTEWLKDLASRGTYSVIGVDAGAARCRRADIVPVEVLGDMDSARPRDFAWAVARGARQSLYDKVKDLTDFQIALASAGAGIVVTGCFGGRFDHLLSIVDGLAAHRPEKDFPRCMIDHLEGIYFLSHGEASLTFRHRPAVISLLALTEECVGVGVSGARWPLIDSSLSRTKHWAVSNELLPDSDTFTASVERGTLGIYWCIEE